MFSFPQLTCLKSWYGRPWALPVPPTHTRDFIEGLYNTLIFPFFVHPLEALCDCGSCSCNECLWLSTCRLCVRDSWFVWEFFLWLLVYAFMNLWFVFLVTITLNCALGNFALPRPKMIVLLPGFFCPKMIVRFICPYINLRLKVKYFHKNLCIKKSLTP